MKTILKATLTIALFAATLFADGQMGSGGYQGCTGENCPPCTVDCPPPCTENCGGRPEEQGVIKGLAEGSVSDDRGSILYAVKFFFDSF
ncbi:MAG: hypothetical protein ABL999_15785 [Pyrinomonadaceae bacterium]